MTGHSLSTLLLVPDNTSKLIISQYQRKPLQFFCYSSEEYRIELWTNLPDKQTWTGLPFVKVRPSEYHLSINTAHSLAQDYEFTLRFKTPNDPCWHWYGYPGQNGIIRITPYSTNLLTAPTFAAVPQLRFVAKEHTKGADLWHFRTQSKEVSGPTCSFSLGKINQPIHSYVSLIRKGLTWLTPVAGRDTFCNRSLLEKWQILLYQEGDEGNIHLWMPMSQKGDCWLSPDQDNHVNFHHSNKDAHLLIVTTTNKRNFAQTIHIAIEYYKKSVMERQEKEETGYVERDSILLDKLGYCTWNSFGKAVDLEKIQTALKSLQMHNIPIGYLLLDDGWQRVSSNRKLVDFNACSDKFPGGLKSSISRLKATYPMIQSIGVWHILWGNWNGVDKALANKLGSAWTAYRTQSNSEICILNDPRLFYQKFYQFLEHAGVDFVKVDNQGSFQDLSISNNARTCLWDSYRRNMVEHADRFFKGPILNCMSLTPHILLDPILSQNNKSIMRNSDDFFPDEIYSHSWHIYANAINSLLTRQFDFTGDWDMFQSDHAFAEYHASSRAISGGPIYITDIPYKHNASLVQRLVGETRKKGYTILRSQCPPQPTFETVFGDPMTSQSLLTLFNLHNEITSSQQQKWWLSSATTYGVCGFWNTGPKEHLGVVKSDLFCSRKLMAARTIAFVVSGPDQGKLVLLEPSNFLEKQLVSDSTSIHTDNSSSTLKEFQFNLPSPTTSCFNMHDSPDMSAMTVRVNQLGSSLVSVSPVKSTGILSIACLGLVDKLNGTRAIARTGFVENSNNDIHYASYEALFYNRSPECGFWIHLDENHTTAASLSNYLCVQMDGIVLEPMKEWIWCPTNSLLTVNMMSISLQASTEDTFCIFISVGRF